MLALNILVHNFILPRWKAGCGTKFWTGWKTTNIKHFQLCANQFFNDCMICVRIDIPWLRKSCYIRQFQHQMLFAMQTQTRHNLIVKANQKQRICLTPISHRLRFLGYVGFEFTLRCWNCLWLSWWQTCVFDVRFSTLDILTQVSFTSTHGWDRVVKCSIVCEFAVEQILVLWHSPCAGVGRTQPSRTRCGDYSIWIHKVIAPISIEVSAQPPHLLLVFWDAIYFDVAHPWCHSHTGSRTHANLEQITGFFFHSDVINEMTEAFTSHGLDCFLFVWWRHKKVFFWFLRFLFVNENNILVITLFLLYTYRKPTIGWSENSRPWFPACWVLPDFNGCSGSWVEMMFTVVQSKHRVALSDHHSADTGTRADAHVMSHLNLKHTSNIPSKQTNLEWWTLCTK